MVGAPPLLQAPCRYAATAQGLWPSELNDWDSFTGSILGIFLKGRGVTYPRPRCGARRIHEILCTGIHHLRGEQKGRCEKEGGRRHGALGGGWWKEGGKNPLCLEIKAINGEGVTAVSRLSSAQLAWSVSAISHLRRL